MTRRTSILFGLLTLACGGPASSTAAPSAPRAPLSVSPPRLADGVTAMEELCAQGAEELCDGVDADCDAHIDEGCEGASPGAIEIAVAWNSGADVDLLVRAPSGEPARVSSRAGCASPAEPRLERVLIDPAQAGTYEIELQHADACAEDAETTASVAITALGTTVGTFNRPLGAGERAPIVAFTVD